MIIAVCVGSACHLRGSYHIIQKLEELIQSHRLERSIDLRANFCMENCGCGTSIRFDDEAPITVTDVADLEKVFAEQVLPRLGRSSK